MINARGPRGFRGPGGGSWGVITPPPSFRGSTKQVTGLWPFSGGSSRPLVGVPLGPDILTGSTVCCDPLSWFTAGLASSPSMLVLGLQGLGKSSLVVRQILGLADRGVIPMVLGDMKPDYADVIRAIGGQVMRLGEGQHLNVLDSGSMGAAADRIGGERGDELHEQALQRSVMMVATLIQIMRGARLADWEDALVARAVRILRDRHRGGIPATLPDLVEVFSAPPRELLVAALVETPQEFAETVRSLVRSLHALLEGSLGRTFAGQTTERIQLDTTGVCIDVSPIRRQSDDVKAAILMATWSEGYATIEAANALAEAGLEPQRHFLTVMDEMWESMRIEGAGLVDKLDGLTRLNRSDGVGNIFITHSLKDMESMASVADSRKAKGFAERSSIVITAGLAMDDLRALSDVKRMSETEMRTVSSWSTPAGWQQRQIRDEQGFWRPAPPPGAGKFLIKLGERAGIQTQVVLTKAELALHDTNSRWLRENAG